MIQELIPDEKRARRAQPLVFAVTMLVWTREGDAYLWSDYRTWLKEAGLRKASYHRLSQPGDVIVATK